LLNTNLQTTTQNLNVINTEIKFTNEKLINTDKKLVTKTNDLNIKLKITNEKLETKIKIFKLSCCYKIKINLI